MFRDVDDLIFGDCIPVVAIDNSRKIKLARDS